MNLIAGARWLFALTARPPARRGSDPADMGTAFGLDAITSLQPDSLGEPLQRELHPVPAITPFEHRLHRRSSL